MSAMPCSMARPAKVDQVREGFSVFSGIGEVMHVTARPVAALLAPSEAAQPDGGPPHPPVWAAQVRVIFSPTFREHPPGEVNGACPQMLKERTRVCSSLGCSSF